MHPLYVQQIIEIGAVIGIHFDQCNASYSPFFQCNGIITLYGHRGEHFEDLFDKFSVSTKEAINKSVYFNFCTPECIVNINLPSLLYRINKKFSILASTVNAGEHTAEEAAEKIITRLPALYIYLFFE